MKLETRLILTFVVRLVFVGFAGWVALAPDALPGAHLITRVGLAAAFLVVGILVGEITSLKTHFQMLVSALRAAGADVRGADPRGSGRDAVAILIRALGAKDAATREKAHRNLQRLTGQDLPADRAAWEAWWAAEGRKAGGR